MNLPPQVDQAVGKCLTAVEWLKTHAWQIFCLILIGLALYLFTRSNDVIVVRKLEHLASADALISQIRELEQEAIRIAEKTETVGLRLIEIKGQIRKVEPVVRLDNLNDQEISDRFTNSGL